jgi:hypothetical protein
MHRTRSSLGALLVATIASTGACARAVTPPPMELSALVEMFLIPSDAPDASLLAWDAGIGADSRVQWPTDGLDEAPAHFDREGLPFQRTGLVGVTSNGLPAYEVSGGQGRLPGAWNVTLRGPRAGVLRVEIANADRAEEVTIDLPGALSAAGWSVEPFRCRRETSPATFGTVVHAIAAPGKRAGWIQESWDFGVLTGLRTVITIHYDEPVAVECVEAPPRPGPLPEPR